MANNKVALSKTICDNAFRSVGFSNFPINTNINHKNVENKIKETNINNTTVNTVKRCLGMCEEYLSDEDCKNKKMLNFSFSNYADSEDWALNFFKCMKLYILHEDTDDFKSNQHIQFIDTNKKSIKLLQQSVSKYKKFLIKNKLFVDSVIDDLFDMNAAAFRYNEENDNDNLKKNKLKSLLKSIYERFIFIDEKSLKINVNNNINNNINNNNNVNNNLNNLLDKKFNNIMFINVNFKYEIRDLSSNRLSFLSAIKKVFGFRKNNPCMLVLFFDDNRFRYSFENIMKFDTKSFINKILKELYTNFHPESSEANKKLFEEIQLEIEQYIDITTDIEQTIIKDKNTKEGNRPFNFTSNNQREKLQKHYNQVEKKISDKLKNYYMCYSNQLNEYESKENDLLIPNFAYEYFEDLVKKKIYKKQKKKDLDENMNELFSKINPKKFKNALPHMMIYYPVFFTKNNCEKYVNNYEDLDVLHKDVFDKLMTEDYKNFGSIVKYNKERIESEYLVYSKNSPQSAGSKKTKKRKKQKFKNNSKKKENSKKRNSKKRKLKKTKK